jgi:hypothetical protein
MGTGRRVRALGLGLVVFTVGIAGSWNGGPAPGDDARLHAGGQLISFGIATADARPAQRVQRREDVRSSRMNEAQAAHFDSLPAGCVQRGRYWYCGGTYYEQVNFDGREVYRVTTP